MSKVTEMVDAQEHLYVLQAEAAARALIDNDKRSACCESSKNARIKLPESDIRPRCECCGAGIEAGACADGSCATRCSRCNAESNKK